MACTVNQDIANRLHEMADVLEQQGANPFRINAYRHAAETLERLDNDLGEIIRQQGPDGLIALPHVGRGIAAAIWEMVATGRWAQLERLRGALEPERLFRTVPGIGPQLARRIHDGLHVDTLEGLEVAAHDGRLQQVPGVGRRRTQAIGSALASMLGRRLRPRPTTDGPDVAVLLAVDREYRAGAMAGKLPTIAPRRFNPRGESWLPILHATRGHWHFTALYSNTARAHELDRTRDWVIIYFYDDHHREGQCTVVTETRGPLTGQRVVRGREAECRDAIKSRVESR